MTEIGSNQSLNVVVLGPRIGIGVPRNEEKINKILRGSDREGIISLIITSEDDKTKKRAWKRLKELKPTEEEIIYISHQYLERMEFTDTEIEIMDEIIQYRKSEENRYSILM